MPTNEHFYERQVIRDSEYLQTVEAAMMQCALQVWGEDGGFTNRKAIALNMFLDTNESARFARFFANIVLYNPTLRGQVFQPALPDPITPQNMDGATLRTAILNAWDVAAGVTGPDEEG